MSCLDRRGHSGAATPQLWCRNSGAGTLDRSGPLKPSQPVRMTVHLDRAETATALGALIQDGQRGDRFQLQCSDEQT
ncbi:MAG: hypothetical protein CBB71_11540 [Rhodopirellula sp. TMED11]|nr:MAG: hypothetical protein CBB71_11540 [Rhodopirellula sp. TMED11]